MARTISIDYGARRTGIAVTDPLGLIAGGLTTVSTSELMTFLKEYIGREKIERIVVGLPRQSDGTPSENKNRVDAFVRKLKTIYPLLPIELYDERFTSVLAHRAMIEGGLRRKARQNKALVDEISATILLQSYMEATKQKKE